MTSRRRVAAVYGMRAPDRVPYMELCVNHPVSSKLLGREAWTGFGGYLRGKIYNSLLAQGRRDEYAERFTADTLAVTRRLGFDVLPVQILPARGVKHEITEIRENVWKHQDGDGRWSIHRWDPSNDFYGEEDSSFRRDPERQLKRDIDRLRGGAGYEPGDGAFDFVRRFRRELPDCFLWGSVGYGIPYDAEGLASLVEFPELWRERAELQVGWNKSYIDAQVAEGVDAFWDGSDWAYKNRTLISPALFREIFLEPYKEIVKHVHAKGMKFVKHTDGDIAVFEEMWFGEAGMDGYHAIEPSAGVDIMAVRDRWPGLLLHGNLDCGRLLTMGSKQEIEDEVVRLIRGLAPASGYVFSSSNSIHSGVPVENLLAMIDAVKRHGTYPIAAPAGRSAAFPPAPGT